MTQSSALPTLVVLPNFTGRPLHLERLVDALAPLKVVLFNLPEEGAQDTESIAQQLQTMLPIGDVVLLAESYSCAIALRLATLSPTVKGLIFANGFLSLPANSCYPLIRHPQLPEKLNSFWTNRRLNKTLFWNMDAPFRTDLANAIRHMASSLYHERALAVKNPPATFVAVTQPCLVLQTNEDNLVEQNLLNELSLLAADIQVGTLSGNHFMLQTHPAKCAAFILNFISNLQQTTS